VKLSVKSDYGARAVLGLARSFASGSARKVEDLAAEQGIPANYLVQILIELKAKQLVRSTRGKGGGYRLARPPGEITLGDVLRAIHGDVLDPPALGDPRCAHELREAWGRFKLAVERAADVLDFQAILDQAGERDRMYYI
jgi:Rrf2 family protein